MRKFTFICEEGNSKTVLEFQAYGFYDVLPKINQFIKASGFDVDDLTVPPAKSSINNSVTYHTGLTVSQLSTLDLSTSNKEQGVWKDYKYDTSKIDHINALAKQNNYGDQYPTMANRYGDQYPTMAPLTSKQLYSWTLNPVKPLTSIDISALTTANLTALKPEDISGLNYKFNL